ncbi:hypothetical protein GCM10023259_052390 [Thermocatellispora tengchongensis]
MRSRYMAARAQAAQAARVQAAQAARVQAAHGWPVRSLTARASPQPVIHTLLLLALAYPQNRVRLHLPSFP